MFTIITVLFKKHKKHLPEILKETRLGELLRYGFSIFLSAWIFQGMLYMDKREALLKILFDLGMTIALASVGIPLWLSFLIAHSLNFAFNGQWFAMYTHMGATNVSPEKFLSYIVAMEQRMNKCTFIASATAHGSLSLGNYKSTSDMDIRVCPIPGAANWFKAVVWAALERFRAFICGFPLDMYLFELEITLRKMSNDEPPIVLVDHQHTLKQIYEKTISFTDFKNIFSERNCR